MPLHPELLALLVCPACRKPLRPVNDATGDATGNTAGDIAGLACGTCALVFPVDHDIPILLIEEAVPEADWARGVRRVKN